MDALEVAPPEVALLLRLVRQHHFEVERMLLNVEETEGLDATKWQARRELTRQVELAQDLIVKLEAAAKGR